MSVINLNTQQIQSLNTEISALDQTLLQSYLPSLDQELSAIRANVQNAEINSLLGTIAEQFNSVKATLSTELPKLEEFLDSQMKEYDTSEEEALAALEAVVAKMQSLADGNASSTSSATASSNRSSSSSSNSSSSTARSGRGGSFDSTNTSTSNGTSTSQTQNSSSKEHGGSGGSYDKDSSSSSNYSRTTKYKETWGSWLQDVKTGFSDTNGLVSAVGNVAEVTLDTAGAVVETAGDAISDVAGGLGNAISWILR